MKGAIDDFKQVVPVALALRKQGMQDRHWAALSESTKIQIAPTEAGFTLNKVIDLGMVEHAETCEDIGEKAFKEHNIEKSLKKMKLEWAGQDFTLPQFKSTTTCYITGFEDAVQILDEHIVTTQAMMFSPFKKPFEEEIEEWCSQLLLVSETLDEWTRCQSQWMYLQPIFDSPDIMK